MFGGAPTTSTLDGILANVVSLVEKYMYRTSSDGPVNPVNEVIFGGVIRVITVDGIPASVVSLVD
jgi:hypothetical protein